MSLQRLAELMGMPTRAAAEAAVKRALLSFIASARAMGLRELVDHFKGFRPGLFADDVFRDIDEDRAA